MSYENCGLQHGYIFLWHFANQDHWCEMATIDGARKQLHEIFDCIGYVLMPDGRLLDKHNAYDELWSGEWDDIESETKPGW